MTISTQTEVGRLADQLERSLRGGAWHGPAIAEVVSGIDAARAVQAQPGSPHTIQELVQHLSFWLGTARDRIAGVDSTARGSDWTEAELSWSQALEHLETATNGLLAIVRGLDDARLDDAVPGSDPTLRGLLMGVLQHNAYHSGQIVELARRSTT